MRKFCHSIVFAAALAGTAFYAQADESLGGEPEVTIVQQGDKTIEEYRINGFLYAVKVIPKKGKPYFLVRADGQDDYFLHSGKPELRIPSWEVFTW